MNKLVRLLNFLGNRRPASLLKIIFLLLKTVSSNNSRSFLYFSLHSFVFQCTVKVSALYKNNFLYANCPFHSLLSRERQLPQEIVLWNRSMQFKRRFLYGTWISIYDFYRLENHQENCYEIWPCTSDLTLKSFCILLKLSSWNRLLWR